MIKKVLVYAYGDQSHASTIEAAASFSIQHGAELTGLFVMPDIINYSTVYGEYPLNLSNAFLDLQADYEKRAREQFEEILAKKDCRSQWHDVEEYEGHPKPSLYTDFIFVSQPDNENSVIFNDTNFVDRLILETGLPTIVIPKDWSANSIGNHILLGWKESKEAVGAVRHALSIMRDAKDVHILTVTRQTKPDEELVQGIEISEYLAEHGINCEYFAERMIESDHQESDTLLRHVDNHARDLIVIGGYGHSRFREVVLGGMTRNLLKTSSVPVLLSH